MINNPTMPEDPMAEIASPEMGAPIDETSPLQGIGQVTFSALDLPQIVDWEEGQEYDITARVVMSTKGEDDGVTSATLDIISVDSGEEVEEVLPGGEIPMEPI